MLLKLDQLQQVLYRFSNLLSFASSDLETVANVPLDIHLWEQRIRLEDHANPALARRQFGNIFPVKYHLARVGLLQAAMILRIVVLPLRRPLANKRFTSATSKVTFSSTEVFQSVADTHHTSGNRNRTPIRIERRWLLFDHGYFGFHGNPLIHIKPIAGKKQYAKNQEREQRQHDGDGIRGFDLAFVELSVNV